MTDDRQLAKPVEEVARALYRAAGGNDPGLVPTAFRNARTAIDTLRALGMISEFGLEAIKAEEREA